jgi:hypothetical protein
MAVRKKAKRKATNRQATKRKAITRRVTTRKAKKRKATRRRAKSGPRAIVTGTVEALSEFASRLAEIPGLVIKRVGF